MLLIGFDNHFHGNKSIHLLITFYSIMGAGSYFKQI